MARKPMNTGSRCHDRWHPLGVDGIDAKVASSPDRPRGRIGHEQEGDRAEAGAAKAQQKPWWQPHWEDPIRKRELFA